MTKPPELSPGLHSGIPMADYLALDYASNSRLTVLRQTPAHMKVFADQDIPSTASLVTGRAAHSAVLEPELFEEKYFRAPEGLKRGTNDWKALEEQWGAGYVLKAVPSKTDPGYDGIVAMKDAVWSKKVTKDRLTGGEAELTGIAQDPETGVMFKFRPDYRKVINGVSQITDYKTTRDASEDAFRKSIWNFGYHRQAALYVLGMALLDEPTDDFVFMAQEKKPPYAVAFWDLDLGALDAGMQQVRNGLRHYAECLSSDKWPGYPDEVRSISLLEWHFREVDDERPRETEGV